MESIALENQYDFVVYTDGACRGNPGPGGWGAFFAHGDTESNEIFGGEPHTTNNKMELTAAIEALKLLPDGSSILLYTDSEYVKNGITQWIIGWKRKGWKTSARKPVKNVELWKALDSESARLSVEWRWVKGHVGDPGNEKADELANRGIDSL